jgi:syntaxin-binding protein 1
MSTSGVRLIVPVLLRNNRDRALNHITFLAIESQVFSLHVPEYFFSMYSPLRSDATARAERDRLMEDIRFVAKSVRFYSSSFPFFSIPRSHARRGAAWGPWGMQIANVCITLNEFPYIRYYVPAHHGPLGALRPHESTRAVARPPENSLRWRTNLARGDQARQYEAADAEVLSRVLAFEVQAALDEYKRANPDFPVRACICAFQTTKAWLT